MHQSKADIIIVGAGPSGLMAAIMAAKSNPEASIIILEKGPLPGRKLLLSGSGRCNITHSGTVDDFLSHYGEHGRFLKNALYSFSNADLIDFLLERGTTTVEEEGGKIFPATGKAQGVLELFIKECAALKVSILTDSRVSAIQHDSGTFSLATTSGIHHAGACIIACGGASYPDSGSSGDGWALARSLGHTVIEPGPALCALYAADYRFADCAGISIRDAGLEIRRNGKLAGRHRGDVLFTHKGLSGPSILDSSRWLRSGDTVRLALGPFASREEAEERLMAHTRVQAQKNLVSILRSLGLPERLAARVIQLSGGSPAATGASLERGLRRSLCESLAGHPFTVKALGGWNEAMVTRGGIALDEVSHKTMESRILSGLFFSGEVIDVDGDSGGYNLQAAFSTGALAGRSSAEKGKR